MNVVATAVALIVMIQLGFALLVASRIVAGALLPPRLDRLRGEVEDWCREALPAATVESAVQYLRWEVEEVAADPTDGEEIADLQIVLFHLAALVDVDLAEEVERKLVINRQRDYGEPDETGLYVRDRGEEG